MNTLPRPLPRSSWAEIYMSHCYMLGYKSPDRSTKVGCVITTEDNVHVASGYNGLPRGIDDDDRFHVRPDKYFYFEHAERNAIYNGARTGARMDLAHTLYITWLPCSDCARAIVQATKIQRVIVHRQGQDAFNDSVGGGDWGKSQEAGAFILEKAKNPVEIQWYTGPILGNLQGVFSGKLYSFSEKGFTCEGDFHESCGYSRSGNM